MSAALPQSGTYRIAAERRRQVAQEGWTPEHDLFHAPGALVHAAIAYALEAGATLSGMTSHGVPSFWPFDLEWWKPTGDPVRDLEKAGALIAAEIDRIQFARSNPALRLHEADVVIRLPDQPVPVKDEAGNVIGEATLSRDGTEVVVSSLTGPVASAIAGGAITGVSIDQPETANPPTDQ